MAGRRRGKGEGSIYRRKDGRWVGQYEVNGKRRYVYGRTRKDVAEKLNKAIAERDAGLVFDAKNLSVDEYLDRWLDTVRGTLAPSTVRRHEELARIHVKPALGKTKLSKLDPLQVQSFYRSKLDEGLSAATVVKVHSTLSKSLKQAVRWRLIPLNVCSSVTPPRIARTEIVPLDARQMKALLKAAESTDLHALWTLLATTGLRIGEALALQWEYVSCQVCKSPPAWFRASYPAINRGCSLNSSFRSSFAIDPALKPVSLRMVVDLPSFCRLPRCYPGLAS